jgi:hypothetical protein
LLVGPAVLFVLGCSGDDGIGTRYPVDGTISYKGAPIEKGVVNFVPVQGDGRPASGQLEKGAFKLTTLTPGDGALPGDYLVTVDTRQVDESAAKAAAEEFAAKKGIKTGMVMVPQEVQAKLLQKTKSDIPGKYQIPQTTDLKATVKEGSNTFTFELKD